MLWHTLIIIAIGILVVILCLHVAEYMFYKRPPSVWPGAVSQPQPAVKKATAPISEITDQIATVEGKIKLPEPIAIPATNVSEKVEIAEPEAVAETNAAEKESISKETEIPAAPAITETNVVIEE